MLGDTEKQKKKPNENRQYGPYNWHWIFFYTECASLARRSQQPVAIRAPVWSLAPI